VVTAAQFPLSPDRTLRDVRLALSSSKKGMTVQRAAAKLPGSTQLDMTARLPARDDGMIEQATATIDISSQNIAAALGNQSDKTTPLNAKTTLLLTRQQLKLDPLQITQKGQTVSGSVLYNPKADEALVATL